ncbi:14364_t:CDS:1 [Dentiscutata heterogama]|uniref:14364_t:CDS:1 n=1 Tax=Dentiscutata heterogama TaxID=1316150 RepID=A0ACA9KQQ9_9GLOM|nr:14364_t:CDS:1 [Dentiscutata heterogama]
MSLEEKSGEIQLSFNASPEMGSKSLYENSLNDEFFSHSFPYSLTLEIEELISPPKNSRKAKNFRKNPSSASPPRPQNAFLLFRRDFHAKLRQKEIKMSNGEVSRLASEEWNKLPKEVLRFFETLEKLAKDRHSEVYPDYKYSPKKGCRKKSLHRINNNVTTEETFRIDNIDGGINFREPNAPEISTDAKYSDTIFDFSEYICFDP